MKALISKLGVLLSLAASTTAAVTASDLGQIGGNPTGGQASLRQNYLNETGQYQGGGHHERMGDTSFGGMCGGSSSGGSGSGSGSRDSGAQSPRTELRDTEQSQGVNQQNPNRLLNNSFHMFGGLQEALGSFAGGGSGTRDMVTKKTAGATAKANLYSETKTQSETEVQDFDKMVQQFGNTSGGGGTMSSSNSSKMITDSVQGPDTIHKHANAAATQPNVQSAQSKDTNKNTGNDKAPKEHISNASLGATLAQTAYQSAVGNNAPGANAGQSKANQNAQKEQGADNLAAMERYHAAAAIDWVRSFLVNFTTDGGNKWNQVRDRLFVPMAILLLLPGAALCQVKSIASQGLAVLGEVSPFEGLFRSIVGIFLIPATYLVVNYGIDVANSITFTIANQYRQQFGSDMYADAFCGHIRAFPVREPDENPGMITDQKTVMFNYFGNTPLARLEGKTLAIKYEDPCSGLYIVPPDRNNDNVPYMVNEQRLAYNQANAAFSMAWVILCAVQQGYLYYLYFVGPVVAALWVFPSKQLRDAFPSWIEGVVTICFWSLFWNVTILLMACFRGVDDTGTIMFTALNFLAIGSAKFAFDFTGLVKDAGREAMSMSQKAAQAAAAASKKGEGGGGGGGGSKGGCDKGGEGNSNGGNSSQNGGEGGTSPSGPDVSSLGSNNSFEFASAGHSASQGHLSAGNANGDFKVNHSAHMPPSFVSKDLAHASWNAGAHGFGHQDIMKALNDFNKAGDGASSEMPSMEFNEEATHLTQLGALNANANPIDGVPAMGDTNKPPLTGAVALGGSTGNNGANGADAKAADAHKGDAKDAAADAKKHLLADAKSEQDSKKAEQISQLSSIQAQERNQQEQKAKDLKNDMENHQKQELFARTSADLNGNGNAQAVVPGQNSMDPVANLSRDSFDANSAIAMGSLDAANKAASDAANAVTVNSGNVGPVAADVTVSNSVTSADNLYLSKDAVNSDASVAGIDYSNSSSAGNYGYDSSSADYQFRYAIDSSASSTISNDYAYPSLTIDGASSSAAQSHAFYEQTYATAYEQTYASAYARSESAAANQAQSIQSERQYAAEQKQMEVRDQAQAAAPSAKSSDMSSQSVRMSSKGVADNRTTNFLTGLVKTATSSKTPPSSNPNNNAAPQSRARSSNPATGGNDSSNSNTAKSAGTTPDADWNSHIANEVLKRRARSVKKQSADEKAADLKSLRNMTSKMD